MHNRTDLRALVFDSLEEQIAVLDQRGIIIDVNAAWATFASENGLSPDGSDVGCNYLDAVYRAFAAGDNLAGEAVQGISDVLSDKCASFYYEYPCHSPLERRWFLMRVSRLKDSANRLFIICHSNITKRKLAEERAEHMALHDPLTGLANRRYFSEFLNNEMRKCVRDQSTTSLVVIDVDYFKDYNDELGHLAGDQCLVRIGQTLQTFSRRPGDLAARVGGDEFALILGGTKMAESQMIADALRKAISDLQLVFGESKQVTVSVGIASVTHDQMQMEDFLLQEADRALYGAKSAGRNCVLHALSDTEKKATPAGVAPRSSGQ